MKVEPDRFDPPRFLLVGADPRGTRRLEPAVVAEGWKALRVGTGTAATPVAATFQPHVAVIEMVLPDLDGLQVMHLLRRDRPRLPVLVLAAVDRAEVRTHALVEGGDDCVSTPFHLPELLSRLRALLRRKRMTTDPAASIVIGDLALHEHPHQVRRGGHPVDLTVSEFELLRHLMTNPGRVLSRDYLRSRLWPPDQTVTVRMIHQHVARLRKKIDAHGPALIHTVRGLGYILEQRKP